MADSVSVATPAFLVPGLDEPTRKRALRWSITDGCFHAIMLGSAESFLGALAVELGHRDTELALLLTLPLLMGALAQLGSSRLARALGSRKRLVVLGALMQAASHLAFMVIAHSEVRSFFPLLGAKMLFWISGSLITPAWGAWMATLTEGIERERYFSRRSAVIQSVLLVSFTSAGAGLHFAKTHGASKVLPAFVVLHSVAVVARLASAFSLMMQFDAPIPPRPQRTIAKLREAVRTSNWRTSGYVATLMFGAYIAVPFFTPYMIQELKFSYLEFAMLTAVPILTKAITYPFLHRLASRFGLRRMLVVSGSSIALVAYAWALSAAPPILYASQVLSGVAWGGLEFASFQLLLLSAEDDYRLEFLSLANSLSSFVQVIAAVMGGMILRNLHLDYRDVFLASALARSIPLLFAMRAIPQRFTGELPRLLLRVSSVLPAGGVFRKPAAIFFPRKKRGS